MIQEAVEEIRSAVGSARALDVGAGTGNVTRHLVQIGCETTAADLSEVTLSWLQSELPQIKTVALSGNGLIEIPDRTYDLVTAYSVLHHIEDYEMFVGELMRVLKPGGVLFIDHEHSDQYWKTGTVLQEFFQEVRPFRPVDWYKFFDPSRYYHRVRRMVQPRYQAEGDIHVFADDHVEWDRVRRAVISGEGEILRDEDYLVFHRWYPKELYDAYKNRCADMHMLMVRKVME